MRKVLFIVAAPNDVGLIHKSIIPTVKLFYIKRGFMVEIIDLYQDQFNPMLKDNLIAASFIKSYRHSIKTAEHIHIFTPTQVGGFSPAMEGFFDNVLIDGYISVDQKIKKKTIFHVLHVNRKRINFFNFANLRLRLLILPKAFTWSKVIQYDLSLLDNANRTKILKDTVNKLSKVLFK